MFEFLGLPGVGKLLEADLERALLDNLQAFLLELGRGFAFVARQFRMSTESKDFYIDLVFYNYLLKCFVLFDLKSGELTHQTSGKWICTSAWLTISSEDRTTTRLSASSSAHRRMRRLCAIPFSMRTNRSSPAGTNLSFLRRKSSGLSLIENATSWLRKQTRGRTSSLASESHGNRWMRHIASPT